MSLILLRPVENEYKVTSPFGERVHPVTGEKDFHKGIDFSCPSGTPVLAPVDGRVVKHGKSENAGITLTLHSVIEEIDWFFNFFHLSEVCQELNNKVSQGDLIAFSGNSGRTTAPCLHFEVWENTAYKDGDVRNPEDYLENIDRGENYA